MSPTAPESFLVNIVVPLNNLVALASFYLVRVFICIVVMIFIIFIIIVIIIAINRP